MACEKERTTNFRFASAGLRVGQIQMMQWFGNVSTSGEGTFLRMVVHSSQQIGFCAAAVSSNIVFLCNHLGIHGDGRVAYVCFQQQSYQISLCLHGFHTLWLHANFY